MKKISSKITAIMIACSCISILLVGGICYLHASRLVHREAEEKLVWMARQYAARFSAELEVIEDRVKELDVHVRTTIDMEALKSDPSYLARYEQELAGYIQAFAQKRTESLAAYCYFNPSLSKEPHDVYYVDGTGDGIPDRQAYIPFSYYDNTPIPEDDKYWWYGPVETQQTTWTNPYEWILVNGEVIKVVSCAQPVYINDELIAVVGTYYRFDALVQTIKNIIVYQNGYASLYNEKLDAIIHPQYFLGTRNNADNLQTVENGLFSEISKQIKVNDYGIEQYSKEGTETFFVYSKLSNGWVLGIHPPVSEVYGGLTSFVFYLVLAALACLLFCTAVAWWMGKYIAKPLLTVVEASKQIGKGDFEVQVEINTKDEVKVLGDALNSMVANVNNLQADLVQLAYYDSLTGIANKNLFEKIVREKLEQEQSKCAYIILDVNKFKLVNDMYGLPTGDLLLKHIASVLMEQQQQGEICARFSADSFHLFVEYKGKNILEKRLRNLAQDICAFAFQERSDYKISVGFGIYVVENVDNTVNILGDKAKLALSKIKGIHGVSLYFYNDAIRNKIIEEQEIENTMEAALHNGEFQMYLQPKFDINTATIKGAEALVRWQHPTKGTIPPGDFIPVFESNGFVAELDMFMLESVCQTIRAWIDAGLPLIPISINQSRQYLHGPAYLSNLVAMLEKYQVPHCYVELEITETTFFENQEDMARIIKQLHESGFKVSMDDFGTGYSSLNMLQDILVDVMKIDRYFFKESIHSERGKTIVNNIIAMASDLKMDVVAEGIETKEQLDFLKNTSCHLVQGYYFSRPITLEAFNALRAEEKKPL